MSFRKDVTAFFNVGSAACRVSKNSTGHAYAMGERHQSEWVNWGGSTAEPVPNTK